MNDMVSSHTLHRITVDEYHRMDEAAIFSADSRIELIEGELVERLVPMNPPHANVVGMLTNRLIVLVGDRAYVRCQLPITLGDLSEPQPDLTIVALPASAYNRRHPTGEEIFAAIEVADSSRKSDLARKVPLYAGFGIEETWVVDLVDSCIRIFRDPRGGEYRDVSIAKIGEKVSLLAFPQIEMSVEKIFE